ncbi:MAG: glyoxalase [Frondihabitans sp.]|nr:glyoxalase [Frondihabitans sp.]
MVTTSYAFSGFSVDNIDRAKAFYSDVLGLTVTDGMAGLVNVELPGGATVLIYPKDDHVPATFTVLNLVVDDIDAAVSELEAAGVTLENYGGYADQRGIMRGRSVGMGPDIAWFLDPAGNILSVLAN